MSRQNTDGHRRAIIEHNLNILLLPGIHVDSHTHGRFQPSTESLISASSHSPPHPNSPSLPVPGTSLSVPSPFHFKLHIITRLSFNEQGRITHHRDYWDVKDVMGLVPGVSLAHWISSRIAAKGLTYAARFLRGERSQLTETSVNSSHDLEAGSTPAASYLNSRRST